MRVGDRSMRGAGFREAAEGGGRVGTMNWRDQIGVPDRAVLGRICSAHRVLGLWLFGSVLRDDFRSSGDVDILVDFEPDAPVGLIELARLQGELSSMFGRSVGLVPIEV